MLLLRNFCLVNKSACGIRVTPRPGCELSLQVSTVPQLLARQSSWLSLARVRMSAPTFLDSISPWGSRSATPKIGAEAPDKKSPKLQPQQGGDHKISNRHRINPRETPEDCPPLSVRWFYAADVPKRKPEAITKPSEIGKTFPPPKKYVTFNKTDSRALESAFQKLAEEEELQGTTKERAIEISEETNDKQGDVSSQGNTSINNATSKERGGSVKVPVNEDYLFDVDIDTRELAPAYWLGPIYDVRRATWFYQDGASSRPCDENLALQLEEGYLKAKPWRYEPPQQKSRPPSWIYGDGGSKATAATGRTPRERSADDTENRKKEGTLAAEPAPPKFQLQTHRLFGTYMNSVVTYQDSTVAWLLTDDFLSRMSSTVYQRFAGGGHLGGIKVVRGFVEPTKAKDSKGEASATERSKSSERGYPSSAKDQPDQRGQAQPSSTSTEDTARPSDEPDNPRSALERRITHLVGSQEPENEQAEAEEVRRREEKEIEQDYRGGEDVKQDREIEHLVLITHGIGQRLGLKLESLNFIHDCNMFRKTLKEVYDGSPDLQALNSEVDKLPKNCRIQILPVLWRHKLDFPKQSFKDNMERDLGDTNSMADMQYPSLSDITVEGVPAIRNLIEDLFLDILLYQSGYREHIARIVQEESNRVYKLFRERNPKFHGKVSFIGHSLGSAIYFDLLCRQRGEEQDPRTRPKSPRHISHARQPSRGAQELTLDFEVEDMYCFGSPIGLFQMLKGKNISARPGVATLPGDEPSTPSMQDTFLQLPTTGAATDFLEPGTTSSPKCKQLFNLFHPTDPIAYRIEPLVSPAMKEIKPQPLPYVKKGLFGAPVQGLSGIGTRAAQSVSDFWSGITTGVASSLLNRSLGLQAADPSQTPQRAHSLSLGATTGVVAGPEELEAAKRRSNSGNALESELEIEHPPTLIDSEIQTLYSGYQKSRNIANSDDGHDLGECADWDEADERARRYRREEAKVRALNSNGRIDYSIQE